MLNWKMIGLTIASMLAVLIMELTLFRHQGISLDYYQRTTLYLLLIAVLKD